ncbi:MAG: Adenylate cyclase 1 [Chloroflexi bacterium]|nr:Adenylate cyclase 1 [Chloroflexota bacterium]
MVGPDLMERFRKAGLEAKGERRKVTVLFADLTDYTSISERIDGEDLYEIIQQYIRLLMECVYRYEGMVDKILGDGILALFGAPIAHENDPERAIRSAMDMQVALKRFNWELNTQIDSRLKMHIGLNSGTVIAGGIGLDDHLDYTVIGDTVNLAQRVGSAAEPDTILVSEKVYHQT